MGHLPLKGKSFAVAILLLSYVLLWGFLLWLSQLFHPDFLCT